jgi:hypothetical protein
MNSGPGRAWPDNKDIENNPMQSNKFSLGGAILPSFQGVSHKAGQSPLHHGDQ